MGRTVDVEIHPIEQQALVELDDQGQIQMRLVYVSGNPDEGDDENE